MSSIGIRRGRYYIDFRVNGNRYREQTDIIDSAVNKRKVQQLVKKMDAEITLGVFDYLSYFPNGKSALKFKSNKEQSSIESNIMPTFAAFSKEWIAEKSVEWSENYQNIVCYRMNKHLLPCFGKKNVNEIFKADIMKFRSHLATLPGQTDNHLSASAINNILLPLRQILEEAADRYDFLSPWKNIKRVRERKKDIAPFSLEDVQLFLSKIRPDFKAYYTTRFFTGLRSGEVDGLQWKYVDFKRRQILVREAWLKGQLTSTKTPGSDREIDMSDLIYRTLKDHKEATKHINSPFVFTSQTGSPLHNRNVSRRVWYPMLNYLGLEKRRPYQTRHTAATLWLAAGENPEWIARQLGHTTTKMLFTVYSRYVPNLTRQDGSAFERLLNDQFNNPSEATNGPSHDLTANPKG